jgi:cobalt transport protein
MLLARCRCGWSNAGGRPGRQVEIFGGADDQAKNLIGEINPDYQPWFEPLIEPASGEIASLLFACRRPLAPASSVTGWVGSHPREDAAWNRSCAKPLAKRHERPVTGADRAVRPTATAGDSFRRPRRAAFALGGLSPLSPPDAEWPPSSRAARRHDAAGAGVAFGATCASRCRRSAFCCSAACRWRCSLDFSDEAPVAAMAARRLGPAAQLAAARWPRWPRCSSSR